MHIMLRPGHMAWGRHEALAACTPRARLLTALCCSLLFELFGLLLSKDNEMHTPLHACSCSRP